MDFVNPQNCKVTRRTPKYRVKEITEIVEKNTEQLSTLQDHLHERRLSLLPQPPAFIERLLRPKPTKRFELICTAAQHFDQVLFTLQEHPVAKPASIWLAKPKCKSEEELDKLEELEAHIINVLGKSVILLEDCDRAIVRDRAWMSNQLRRRPSDEDGRGTAKVLNEGQQEVLASELDRKTQRRILPAITPRSLSRPFTSTTPLSKKSGKANRSQAKTDSSPPAEGAARATAVDEAFDFSNLESKILKSIESLTHDLAQLRSGGRFNPEKIEQLRVTFNDGEGKKVSTKVGDLAQVSARGRNVSVVVHEVDHVKLVNTTIVTSDLNLTPHGPTTEAPTTLTIQVPPPTGETRQLALQSASKSGEEALHRIREARGGHQKKLRDYQKAKSVRPDDLQKAQKQMEEVVKKGNEDVKRITDECKKVLDKA
ncbi:hypothetical protein EG328_005245 [Venturia inaequalis]|uniref:Ribosome recycling factor domain-containing protein n=1 Tax=Venturia inaequalis TaxID=5025 RepID=A0A8H3YW76_VENIN|nr:hypothetical protein EG328_005245 [Venturia inaequalis]